MSTKTKPHSQSTRTSIPMILWCISFWGHTNFISTKYILLLHFVFDCDKSWRTKNQIVWWKCVSHKINKTSIFICLGCTKLSVFYYHIFAFKRLNNVQIYSSFIRKMKEFFLFFLKKKNICFTSWDCVFFRVVFIKSSHLNILYIGLVWKPLLIVCGFSLVIGEENNPVSFNYSMAYFFDLYFYLL